MQLREAILLPTVLSSVFDFARATFAEFEADLIKLRGKKQKLSECQKKELRRMNETGEYSISDLAALFSISRKTIYRSLDRQASAVPA